THLPLLIGGKGEHRSIPTAAALADEWNAWTTVEQFRHKREVLVRHADKAGRDPRSLRCSTQALVVFDGGAATVDEVAGRFPGRPIVAGSDQQILDHLVRYHRAGVDEFIVPDWHWENRAERDDSYDRFFELTKPMRLP
ncbi:MAG: hypothetical protein GX868_16290, partial [Actinobacteria bacterium]|nr:hypothetical protein [Actinomycetota bacterium]